MEMKGKAAQEQGGDDTNEEDSFGGVYLGPPGWLEGRNRERGDGVGNADPQSAGKEADPYNNNVCAETSGIECRTNRYQDEGGNLDVTCNVSGDTNITNGKLNVIVQVHVEKE